MEKTILLWLRLLWLKVLGAGVLSSMKGDFSAVTLAGKKIIRTSGLSGLTAGAVLGGYVRTADGKRRWLSADYVTVSGGDIEFADEEEPFSGTEAVALFVLGAIEGVKGQVFSREFEVPDTGLEEDIDLTGLFDFTRCDRLELQVAAVADEEIPVNTGAEVSVKAKGVMVCGDEPVIIGGALASSKKKALAVIQRGVIVNGATQQTDGGFDSLEAVPFSPFGVMDGILHVKFEGGESIYDPGVKATGSVRVTGEAGTTVKVDDVFTASAKEKNFLATEEKSIPEGTGPVTIDADTDTCAATAHGFAEGTKGRFTAKIVDAVKATATLIVKGVGGALVEIGDKFFAHDGEIEFKALAGVLIPTGALSVIADPDTDKFTAEAHGFADGTKGRFTAAIIPAENAVGTARFTGDGGTVIPQGTIVETEDDVEFETDEQVTIPTGALSVVADPDTDKFEAEAHGFADGTKGRFTAPYVNKATGEVVLTGVSEGAIAIDDEVSTSGGSPIVFKATENKAFPADGIAVTADPETDKFRHDGHTYTVGTKGRFSGTTLPSGIATNTDYWIVWSDDDYFQVSLTEGGEVDTFSTAGEDVVFTASVRKMKVAVEAKEAGSSGNVPAGAISVIDHEDFSAVTNPEPTTGGDDEMDLPDGILADTDYYMVNVGEDDFQVSLSEDGDPITFSGTGNDVVFTPSVRKVDVAVTAVEGGAAGNIAAHELVAWEGEITGLSAVDSPEAMTGGVDAYYDLPTGINAETDYYMVNAGANDFQVSLTEGGDPVSFSGTGNSVVFTPSVRAVSLSVEASVGGTSGNVGAGEIDEFDPLIVGIESVTNPSAATGGVDEYQLLPTGITETTDLWLRDVGEDSFKVALTENGAAFNFTDTGTDVVFNPSVRKIDVAVEAEEAGDAWNLDANEIDNTEIEGVSSVTNPAATSGGIDPTPEDTYKVRVTLTGR